MFDVAIVDYGYGNLFSVKCACDYVGLNSTITNNKKKILSSKSIIIPGVGSFSSAMKVIKKKKLDKIILEFNKSKKPIIGICLGMQLMFSKSFENGVTKGLNLFKGEVVKLNTNKLNIGWSKISCEKNKNFIKLLNLKEMYFIHSYKVKTDDDRDLLALSNFKKEIFCAAVKKDNLIGLQFHPEKSGNDGIEIYKYLKKII
ncbi:imidazole glycerol phosphate synthase subunit HisH [Candidatus Pelagibacter sp.]|nr:imidazole glycerol phosphate synthase subunit HisH [Candidatus Pelagibacter sp.]